MMRLLSVLPLCALLAACAAQSPTRTDPLADLVGNAKIVESPMRNVASTRTKSIAVIVSTNSETQIRHRTEMDAKYLEGYVKVFASRSYNAVKAQQESVGPRKLIDAVVAQLRERFASVTVVADLAEFRERKKDVAAVVDIGMEYKSDSGLSKNVAEYTTDITLILFDREIRKIGVARGVASETGERDNTQDNVKAVLLVFADTPPDEFIRPLIEAERKSRASAFRLLGESLDQLVQR